MTGTDPIRSFEFWSRIAAWTNTVIDRDFPSCGVSPSGRSRGMTSISNFRSSFQLKCKVNRFVGSYRDILCSDMTPSHEVDRYQEVLLRKDYSSINNRVDGVSFIQILLIGIVSYAKNRNKLCLYSDMTKL
ncbi:hypothetical protein CDAR_307031 [Caerostris darwini]|uniref:Uncharacterized protein n=1 Tax=Caerostris darwini TaxID=1538125 RepID=A0AAV4RYI9_9ARAC|nr:hypothetical protein CDAR_307031 [Caerostris darwini]